MTPWIITTFALLLLVWTRHMLRRTRRQLALSVMRELAARPYRAWPGASAREIAFATGEMLPPGIVNVVLGDLERAGLIISNMDHIDGFRRYELIGPHVSSRKALP